MASEAEASCESDPNFAIICAFIEKFGELCGIGNIDFVDLQNMLENNQEVSPDLMNIHIKLLRKTKKNVTVERWERALVNMCHHYSSKDAWEIERFGYKKTRLQVRLRALKELLEMQFDYNTKFKNEVNKMSAESLRPQPLGRDKLGRAYWFQTDNNYQIRIYKEDPDEETWQLVAKDREGLLSLMTELADGDSKLSSDSALNEDSNSLSEKPFIDTGQSEKKTIKSDDDSSTAEKEKEETDVEAASKKSENVEEVKNDSEDVENQDEEACTNSDSEQSEEKAKDAGESEEANRPILRIKSLSELMEKPKETKKNLLEDLPELTIIKKPKVDLSQVTITKIPKGTKEVEVSPAIESPVMIIEGEGSGHDNECFETIVSEAIEEPVMFVCGSGSGSDCKAGNEKFPREANQENKSASVSKPVSHFNCGLLEKEELEEIIVSEEIEEEVMFIFGEGSGYDCLTGNEKEETATQQTEKSETIDACTKLNTAESQNKVPIDTVSLDSEINSKTETENLDDECGTPKEENVSVKKAQFFFGPGSLKIKPSPVNASLEESDLTANSSANNGSVSFENKEKEESYVNEENDENIVDSEKENAVISTEETSVEKENNENEEAAIESEELVENNTEEKELPVSKETNCEDEVKDEKISGGDIKNDQQKDQTKDEITHSSEKIQEEKKEETVEASCTEKQDSEVNESCENIPEDIKLQSESEEKLDTLENKVGDDEKIENNKGDTKEEKVKKVISEEEEKREEDDEIEIKENKEEITVPNEHKDEEKSSEDISEEDETKGKIMDKSEPKEENEKSGDEIEDKPKSEDEAGSERITEETEITEEKTKKDAESNENVTEDSEKDEDGKTVTEKVEEEDKPEETNDESEVEPKEQGPATKRKRVTRNTPALNDSFTEETMNPRKKVPIEKTKKKGPQKSAKTSDDNKEDPKVESAPVEETTTRQTRQTRGSAATKVQAPAVAVKPRGRSKKNAPQASKSDEIPSPAPLESVTIVDTDSSNTQAENPEKDPLAVSEEETGGVNPTVSTITSFSFDYNPSSPVPEKRSARKRGRETLEEKTEVPEKEVKKPKIRGRRNVDQTLRKSVEEKRQQVGDGSSDENEQTKAEPKGKAGKKGAAKKVETPTVSDSDNSSQKSTKRGRKVAGKNKRMLQNLGVNVEDISSISESTAPVRQSRRLAQIKIKEEATRRKIEEPDISSKKKKKKSDDKDFKVGKRKRFEEEVKPAPTQPVVDKKKKRKAKQDKCSIGWETSSEDDFSNQEEEEVSEYEEHHEEEPLQFKSDHEFSPESDLECDEALPLKRARTVRKEELDDEEPEEEFPCQKCGKSDHPEWILLCDKCDNGWHCSCLRPALFVIPEGDWYCPTCQHETLMENLNQKLIEFDKMMVKKEMEDRRKERLAYVGISLNNVLPAKEKKEKRAEKSSESEESSRENTGSGSDSDESDSDEPIYQLRQRRQAHSYKFQDYDDLINSALEEVPPPEVEKTHTAGRGKDIATIVNAAKEEEEKNGFDDLPPVVPRDPEESRRKAMSYRKKPKRLNNLEVNSDDEADDSDEDFKGSSSEESEEEDDSGDSDDSLVGRRKSRAVRRSTRARTTRYDNDFINDDDSDYAPSKKKKKKRYFSDSESSLSDDWRGKKKKSSKKSKKKKSFDDSDLENYRKKKPKIKYGMSSDEDIRGRRTRGKKTSYLDTLGSDSDEETLKKKIKDRSDDEYVAEDDEEKESEEDVDKPSDDEDEEEERIKKKKHNSEDSESEEEALMVKKVKLKAKRTIMDSEDEEEDNDQEEKKEEKKSVEKKIETPKELDKNQIINEELAKTVREFDAHVIEPPKSSAQPEGLSRPAVVPGLNVEKLKACGITVTKIAKDKADIPPMTSPSKLVEIGTRPTVPVLMQRNNPPINLRKIEKSLDELDEDEVEEMMEDEEFANRQLELAAIQIREAKRKREEEERKGGTQPPLTPATKRPSDVVLKKPTSGRFFNMKPPQESMLGDSSLVMNDDDNDELSEPPGVTLPLFSELGSMKVQNLSKSRNDDTPPPPSSPNRAVPVSLHNMGVPHSQIANSFGPPRGMMHHMRPTRPMGPRGSMPPMMGARGPPPMDHNSLMGRRGPQMEHNPSMMGPRGMERNNIPMMGSREHNNSIMGPRGPHPMENRPRIPPPLDHNNLSMMRLRGPPPMDHNNPSMMVPRGPMDPSMMGLRGPPPMDHNNPQFRGNLPPIPRNANLPPMSSGGPMPNNLPMSSSANLPVSSVATTTVPSSLSMSVGGANAHSVGGANVPVGQGHGNGAGAVNESPDGTPKKRRGRGKGKKTLAAEAAAAAAVSGGTPEPNKPGNGMQQQPPAAANIEIASPPQPFSQSQPAPSVITRMLQTTAADGKSGPFPVGRIRPKQFAMMQDSDEGDSPRPPADTQEKDMPPQPQPQPAAPPHGGHQPSHYGPPPGQYPPNYYPKDAQSQQSPHSYHHQRPQPPPMHPYPPHPSQPPMEPPPINPQPHQPPINMPDPSAIGQFPPAQPAPPPSKSPFEGMPPHRPPYSNSNPAYNYDYAPPPQMPEEGVAPSYDTPSSYPEQYDAGSSSMEGKGVDDEPVGEFGGLVSYFSSQHEDELEQ